MLYKSSCTQPHQCKKHHRDSSGELDLTFIPGPSLHKKARDCSSLTCVKESKHLCITLNIQFNYFEHCNHCICSTLFLDVLCCFKEFFFVKKKMTWPPKAKPKVKISAHQDFISIRLQDHCHLEAQWSFS